MTSLEISQIKKNRSSSSWNNLVQQGCTLVKQERAVQWMLGELASMVKKEYGEGKLQQFADDIGIKYNTLRIYRTTYWRWINAQNMTWTLPANGRRTKQTRINRPPFSICKTLNPHPDRFKLVKSKPNMTMREARKIMQEYRKQEYRKQN